MPLPQFGQSIGSTNAGQFVFGDHTYQIKDGQVLIQQGGQWLNGDNSLLNNPSFMSAAQYQNNPPAPGTQPNAPTTNTTNTTTAPTASTTPAGPPDPRNASSDPNAMNKAAQVLQTMPGFSVVNVRDNMGTDQQGNPTTTPDGQLAVTVRFDATGAVGNMLVANGSNGQPYISQLPTDAVGQPMRIPTPASTTGTTAQQENADTNKAKADAAKAAQIEKQYADAGIAVVVDPSTGQVTPIGMKQPTNPSDMAPKIVGGRLYKWQPGTPDSAGNAQGKWQDTGPAPQAPMTPAEQQGAQNQNEQLKLQAAKDAADQAAQKATEESQSALDTLQAQRDAIDAKYKDWQSWADSQQEARAWWEDQYKALQDQANNALQKAQLAISAQGQAQSAWDQYQTQLTNQQNTALKAAQQLETNRADLANEENQRQNTLTNRATIGADMIKQRAANATSLLNNFMTQVTGNKNFGTGGANIQGLGAGMLNLFNDQATAGMGGPDLLNNAAAMVHAANPDIQGTPQAAGYTAVVQQMLERLANPNNLAQPDTTRTDTAVNNALATPAATPPELPAAATAPPPAAPSSAAADVQPINTVQPTTPIPAVPNVAPPVQNVTLGGNANINLPPFNPNVNGPQ